MISGGPQLIRHSWAVLDIMNLAWELDEGNNIADLWVKCSLPAPTAAAVSMVLHGLVLVCGCCWLWQACWACCCMLLHKRIIPPVMPMSEHGEDGIDVPPVAAYCGDCALHLPVAAGEHQDRLLS